MITANIFDHDKRKRSFEIVAEVLRPDPAAGRNSELTRHSRIRHGVLHKRRRTSTVRPSRRALRALLRMK